MDRYTQFTEAYRNLNLFPLLEAEEIEKFRVPYGQRTLARLRSAIQAAGDADKLIFTGHRGLRQVNPAGPTGATNAG